MLDARRRAQLALHAGRAAGIAPGPAEPGPAPCAAITAAPTGASGSSWQLLAAVELRESAFGRLRNERGRRPGPMQFIPATWRAYGMGGDIPDPHDAILGAANYLHASGAPGDYRGALSRLQPVVAYVNAVSATRAGSRARATPSTPSTAGRSSSVRPPASPGERARDCTKQEMTPEPFSLGMVLPMRRNESSSRRMFH